ncbi:unnamed protein product, partial [marine sediment metagenome]
KGGWEEKEMLKMGGEVDKTHGYSCHWAIQSL